MHAVILCLSSALAADADPFRPAGSLSSGVGTLQGESPYLVGDGPGGGLYASFAQDLALGADGASLLASAVPLEFYGAWTMRAQNARFEMFAPVYGYVDAPVNGFTGPALGDLRLQANAVVMQTSDVVRVSILPRVGLPTGTSSAVTRRGFEVGVTTAVAGRVGRFGWLANAGVAFSESSELPRDGVGLGSTGEALLGITWQVTEPSADPETPTGFRIGAEVDGSIGMVKRAQGANQFSTGHVFAQNLLPSGLGLTVGAGTALLRGVGAPDYRVVGALTFTPLIRDADGDGLLDDVDACPTAPEDVDGWEDDDGCPDGDDDRDGLPDVSDTCPREPEDFDGWQDQDGCPELDNDGDQLVDLDDRCPDLAGPVSLLGCPDRDGDGVRDAEDACPDVPGLPEFEGCADRDRDRVPDPRDACPADPIPPDADPLRSDGCPKLAYVSAGRITITEQVKFETGKAIIRPESFGLLDTVARVLTENPQIRKVEVAGHTDNVGSESYNLELSQSRADSVAAYVGEHGVARSRLTSRGYGESKPADTNRTELGRTNNRRVEFVIVDQDEQVVPAPAPVPSPAPGPLPGRTVPDAWDGERDPEELKNPWSEAPQPQPTSAPPAVDAAPVPLAIPADEPVIDPTPPVVPTVEPEAAPERPKRPPRRSKKR
jgi:OOP family OmpA-OmpF porin